jgi:site-specific DNA recombinase
MARKSRKNTITAQPTSPAATVWKAALYIRLSVEFNSNKGDSLETQKDIMEAHLALHPDIEIAGVYTDNGVSGQTFQRPSFQRMLEDIESGKITCVVTKDLSRLGRSTIDTGYYIERYFPQHHVRYIAVNDQFDSEDSENNGSHIILPLKNMINEAYAADIARKVRAQQRQAMQEGQFVGARPPYGYKKDPDNCHKLLVNEDTAPVVRQIFQWASEGVALNKIVKLLNETGALTPGVYSASHAQTANQYLIGGGKWQSRSVTKILKDEVYTGDMVQGKSKSISRKQYPTPPEEWIRVPHTHEAIISREMFEKVQAIQAQTAADSMRLPLRTYSSNILRGKIYCGCCGRHLNRHRDNRSNEYCFVCIANSRLGTGNCAISPRIQENTLFQTILSTIQQEAKAVLSNRLMLKQDNSRLSKQKADTAREISRLQAEVDKNRKFMSTLYENFVSGLLTGTEYTEMKAGYEQKISQGVSSIQSLTAQMKELECQVGQYITLAGQLEKVSQDTELTAQLVDQLIERVTVFSSTEIKVDFRFHTGFERVMEVLADE